MKASILVAVIAATPPTLAAVLTFLASRSAMRRDYERHAIAMSHSLNALEATVGRVEATVERIDAGVDDLRERVARLEGAQNPRVVRG